MNNEITREYVAELEDKIKVINTLIAQNEAFRSRIDRDSKVIESYANDVSEHEKIQESLQNENTKLRQVIAQMKESCDLADRKAANMQKMTQTTIAPQKNTIDQLLSHYSKNTLELLDTRAQLRSTKAQLADTQAQLARESELLDYVIDRTEKLEITAPAPTYRYKIVCAGTYNCTATIEYDGNIYHPERYEDMNIYKDGSGFYRTLYYTINAPIDITKCVIKAYDQLGRYNTVPITVVQIE
ncbi:hypothetical protein F-VV57_0048 [Faustovirus]|nr:hypothetical protein F-VV57_0048 [Faustovirus]QJX73315.1 hypothetical protein F-VV63_0049 [Faustovirus]